MSVPVDPRTQRLGAYELLDELGRGGMGVVYRARHGPTGAIRALKIVMGDADELSLVRFRREMEALARVAGDGIVPVHEAGEERGRLFFVMGFMSGGSLRSRLRAAGRLPWGEAASIVAELARALERCHEAGIVHRDIKPDNVLFDEAGRPRLADFGAVRDVKATTLTQSGALIGTPVYMAPEQLDGTRVDGRADVYALGILLIELVTGAPPHAQAKSLFQMLSAKQAGTSSSFEGVAGVPRGLEAIAGKALAAKPESRQRSVGELAAELEGLVAAGGDPRSPRGLLAFAALLVACVAVGAWFLRPAPKADSKVEDPRPPAPRSIRLLAEHGDRRWKHAGVIFSVAFSPDGTRAVSGSTDGTAKVWDARTGEELRSLDDPLPRPIAPVVRAAFVATNVVATAANSTLRLHDLGDGSSRSFELGGRSRHLVDAGDGRRLLVTYRVETGFVSAVWDVLEAREVTRFAVAVPVSSTALAPGGKQAVIGGEDGSVTLWDLLAHDAVSRELTKHAAPVAAVAFAPGGRVFSLSQDGELRLSDPAAPGEGRTVTPGKEGRALAVRDGKLLVGVDHALRLLDAGDLSLLASVEPHPWHKCWNVAISPDGTRALASIDHWIGVYDLPSLREVGAPEAWHREWVNVLSLSRDGRTLVSGSFAGTLVVAHVSSGGLELEPRVLDTKCPVSAVAVSPKGDLYASSGARNQLLLWDGAKASGVDNGPLERVSGAVFSPDGRQIVTTHYEARTIVRRHRNGRVEDPRLEGPAPSSVAFSPDGSQFVVSGQVLRLWGSWTGKESVIATEQIGPVAWSPDGKLMAGGEWFGDSVTIFSASGSKIQGIRTGHAQVTGVAFSGPDRLVTVGLDGMVRLWDASSGALVAEDGSVARRSDRTECVVALDARRVAVGTARGVLAVFELP